MDTTTIICPSCATAIPLSDALTHQLRDQLKGEFEKEMGKKSQELKAKEEALLEERKKLEESLQEKIDAEKKKLWVIAQQKAAEKNESEVKELKEAFLEKEKKLEEMRKQELLLRKEKRDLEEKEKELQLTMMRKLDEERKKIEEQTQKKVSDEMVLKLQEKEKQMEQMKKTIEDLKRKSEQGSMQVQGDAQETNLKMQLQQSFPVDSISDVPTGIRGADLVQEVISSLGQKSGIILWESKNTKAWSQQWIQKLKDDQMQMKAEVAILVSQALPEGIEHFAQIEGIWVTNPASAVALAQALRYHIMELGKMKVSLVGKGEKMEVLYQYLSGGEFRSRVENIVSAFVHLQQELESERRAMERIWNRRQKELERVIANTSGMYGDLQGIAGASIPNIPSLQFPFDTEEDREV